MGCFTLMQAPVLLDVLVDVRREVQRMQRRRWPGRPSICHCCGRILLCFDG